MDPRTDTDPLFYGIGEVTTHLFLLAHQENISQATTTAGAESRDTVTIYPQQSGPRGKKMDRRPSTVPPKVRFLQPRTRKCNSKDTTIAARPCLQGRRINPPARDTTFGPQTQTSTPENGSVRGIRMRASHPETEIGTKTAIAGAARSSSETGEIEGDRTL
jgi:hypothetical protein